MGHPGGADGGAVCERNVFERECVGECRERM